MKAGVVAESRLGRRKVQEPSRKARNLSLNGNPPAADKTPVDATIIPVADLDTTSEVKGPPTRREITVIAVMMAVVIASVLLLIVASGRVAAMLSTSV